MFAQVVVPLPLGPLTYKIPSGIALAPGQAVWVSVRRKRISGVVLEVQSEQGETKFEIKELSGLSDEFPCLSSSTLKFLSWAAEYYHCPMGEVLRGFLPPMPSTKKQELYRLAKGASEILSQGQIKVRGKKQQEILAQAQAGQAIGLLKGEREFAKKLAALGLLEPFVQEQHLESPPAKEKIAPGFSPNSEQLAALEKIRGALGEKKFAAFLLQGVTGSGKTEVYLRSALHALELGKNVLVVVPEIALTPQLVSRFESRLGTSIAVLHSGISDRERSNRWHLLNRGEFKVCIGARSAALSPIQNLGLVIVDEEHDSAFKQDDHLRYNARDLAVIRAKFSDATVILGSATPSLESLHNAQSGRYTHLELKERASGLTLPEVVVVDRSKESSEGTIGARLKMEMNRALSAGGQVMLLLNRRGYSSFLLCESCGHVPECPACSVSLTNYASSRQLKCHYCGFSKKMPAGCEKCGHPEMKAGTLGTESLEEEVKSLFPGKTVIRVDRESMERKGALENALAAIASGAAQIVIGTQIIAKGHDFPNIALVGVVNADSSFHLPDFRASEKSFQLFTQMAGRAGRSGQTGRVIIQTHNPKHPSVFFSQSHDFRAFSEQELQFRHAFRYPPYSRLARIVVSGANDALVEKYVEKLCHALEPLAAKQEIDLIGPAPAPLHKLNNKFRWNFLLKGQSLAKLHSLLNQLAAWEAKMKDRKCHVQIDVDPLSLM